MVAALKARRIVGKWISGHALDLHTISSTHIGINEFGHDIFDTIRSELGELLYRLKYRADSSAGEEIVEAACGFLRPFRHRFDLMVPVPPSGKRCVQPVVLLATAIGEALNLPVVECVTTTRPATQLKGVMDRERREKLLEGLYAVDRAVTRGKSILLFDDLYRSGATDERDYGFVDDQRWGKRGSRADYH